MTSCGYGGEAGTAESLLGALVARMPNAREHGRRFLSDALEEFLVRSRTWHDQAVRVLTVPDQQVYSARPGAGRVVRIVDVYASAPGARETRLERHTEQVRGLADGFVGAVSSATGDPRTGTPPSLGSHRAAGAHGQRWYESEPGVLTLHEPVHTEAVLRLHVVLASSDPERASTSGPVLARWRETVLAGAMAHAAASQSGQTRDDGLIAYHRERFERGIQEAVRTWQGVLSTERPPMTRTRAHGIAAGTRVRGR